MAKTVAESLRSDARITEAKRLVLEALSEHQQGVTQVKAADPALTASYQATLEQLGKDRGGALWYPYLGSGIGHGALVELADGSVKYDLINGIGVHPGHSVPDIVAAAFDAVVGDTIMQGNLQQNEESAALAKLLVDSSGMDHCFLTSSGVMACENALKIAFQKKEPASRVLAFKHCFMGRTLACSQITDKPANRVGLPHTLDVDYVPFYDENNPDGSTEAAVNTLREHLRAHPGQHAVMCMELVQGEGGFYPGNRDFFQALIRVLKEHDILVLVDEVQTFGRTSELYAFHHFGLQDDVDLVTIGKQAQVCATLYRAQHKPKPGLLSQTFTSSTSAIHAGKALIEHFIHGGYFGAEGKIAKLHEAMVSRLESISERHPDLLTGPYGIGTMIAFTPLGGDSKKVLAFSHALYDAGIISFIAGSDPMRIRFLLPAPALQDEDLDSIAKILEETLVKQSNT